MAKEKPPNFSGYIERKDELKHLAIDMKCNLIDLVNQAISDFINNKKGDDSE
jgi:hypothetical protein